MPSATVSPTSAVAQQDPTSDSIEDTCLRAAVARIAASLVRLTETTAPLREAPESRAVTEHIEIGKAVYSVRGEVLVHAAMPPVVVIAIERQSAVHLCAYELGVTFGLTRAEARVAALLAERMSNQEIAQQLGVTGHTARRHTEKVLLKLEIHRRNDVRRVLLNCMQPGEAVPHSPHDDAEPMMRLATSHQGSTPER